MFTMQRWLDRAQRALDGAISASRSSLTSLDRKQAEVMCNEVRRAFPFIQVLALGTAIVLMCGLAALAGWDARAQVPVYHTMGPALVLLLLYLATAYAYRREGVGALRDAAEYLGVPQEEPPR